MTFLLQKSKILKSVINGSITEKESTFFLVAFLSQLKCATFGMREREQSADFLFFLVCFISLFFLTQLWPFQVTKDGSTAVNFLLEEYCLEPARCSLSLTDFELTFSQKQN